MWTKTLLHKMLMTSSQQPESSMTIVSPTSRSVGLVTLGQVFFGMHSHLNVLQQALGSTTTTLWNFPHVGISVFLHNVGTHPQIVLSQHVPFWTTSRISYSSQTGSAGHDPIHCLIHLSQQYLSSFTHTWPTSSRSSDGFGS